MRVVFLPALRRCLIMLSRWWIYPLLGLAALAVFLALIVGYAAVVAYPNLPSLEALTSYQPKIPLPNKSEMEALLTDINQAGLGRGLQFELFRPAPAETRSEFYAELPITIKLGGNYHDIGAFASDISQLSRIVTLNDIALSASKGGLTLDAVAKTFRYLDDSEVAAQRRAARDAAAPKKK